VLARERHVVLSPEPLQQLDPLDQPRHAIRPRQPVELAFDAAAFLGHDARARHQHRAAFRQQVKTGPLVGQQHRVAQHEAGHARGAKPHLLRSRGDAREQRDPAGNRRARRTIDERVAAVEGEVAHVDDVGLLEENNDLS